MTKSEMKIWLGERYNEQLKKYPKMGIRSHYIAANLLYMKASAYWRARPFDSKDAKEWRDRL